VSARLKPGRPGESLLGIDRLIHEPARMMIMSHLYVVDSADFLFLVNQTRMTHGNLSSHINKLESAGYLQVTKEFLDKKPHTVLRLTKIGRIAFREYLKDIRNAVRTLPNK